VPAGALTLGPLLEYREGGVPAHGAIPRKTLPWHLPAGQLFSNYIPSRQTGQERVLPHIFRFTVGTGIPESLFSVVSARDMLKIKEYVFAREAMNSLPESGRS